MRTSNLTNFSIYIMINFTVQSVSENYPQLIDDGSVIMFTYIVLTVLCSCVSIFGIVSNFINIMCFAKQGFKETINISLMGLAISDIGCLVSSCFINIFFTPAMSEADLPFDVHEISFQVGAMPHLICTRITSWITAIIILERCLCVLMPLKVKQIITPRRMLAVVFSVFIILIFCGVPIYFVQNLGMKFSPSRNRTLLRLIIIEDGEFYSMIYFTINSFIVPFLAFILICICTVILVYNLQQQTKWRNASSTSSATGVSTRSRKVARMVVMISALYISCTIPITLTLLAVAIEPGLRLGGKHVNVGVVCGGIGILAESINSSGNIFIYYHMSSKFKEKFLHIFCKINNHKESIDGI